MSWITPKTNWINDDYFNLTDYERIKGNIEYLSSLIGYVSNLETATIETVPHASFFNKIVYYTNFLYEYITNNKSGFNKTYAGNDVAFTARELNIIETYHRLSYLALTNRKTLAFRLGGVKY